MRRLLAARTLVLCLLALGLLSGSVPPLHAADTPPIQVRGGTLVEGLLDDPDSLLPECQRPALCTAGAADALCPTVLL